MSAIFEYGREYKIERLQTFIAQFIEETQRKKIDLFMLLGCQQDVERVVVHLRKEDLPIRFMLTGRTTEIDIVPGFHHVSFAIYPRGRGFEGAQTGLTLTDLFQALSKLPKI